MRAVRSAASGVSSWTRELCSKSQMVSTACSTARSLQEMAARRSRSLAHIASPQPSMSSTLAVSRVTGSMTVSGRSSWTLSATTT